MDAVEFCIHRNECDLMIHSVLKYDMDDVDDSREPLMDATDLYIIHEAARRVLLYHPLTRLSPICQDY